MQILNAHGMVHCFHTLELPLSATSVWGQLRDFRRYAQQDFFHSAITIEGNVPRAGAKLTMTHSYAGIQISRVGRILLWREGVGYSFSDLSRRGPRCGFPHVFGYRLEPMTLTSCRLHISVRGRWTARFVPHWLAKLWLIWVFSYVVRSVANQLLVYQLWRADSFRKPEGIT